MPGDYENYFTHIATRQLFFFFGDSLTVESVVPDHQQFSRIHGPWLQLFKFISLPKVIVVSRDQQSSNTFLRLTLNIFPPSILSASTKVFDANSYLMCVFLRTTGVRTVERCHFASTIPLFQLVTSFSRPIRRRLLIHMKTQNCKRAICSMHNRRSHCGVLQLIPLCILVYLLCRQTILRDKPYEHKPTSFCNWQFSSTIRISQNQLYGKLTVCFSWASVMLLLMGSPFVSRPLK